MKMKSYLPYRHIQKQLSPYLLSLQNKCYCSEAKSELKPNPNEWRRPWSKREGEWTSKFALFAPEKGNNVDLISLIQRRWDLRPEAIRKWFQGMKDDAALLDMRYIPERHEILGSNLAAAHFLVHRGAMIRFKGSSEWIKRVGDEYPIPNKYDPAYVIEAIDLADMRLFNEGYSNMTNLKHLKWLCLKNSVLVDDWTIDKISGEYNDSLEYLDVSNCTNVTYRGISALYRMEKLQTLKVNGISDSQEFQLTCLMLEDLLPPLKVEGIKYLELQQEN